MQKKDRYMYMNPSEIVYTDHKDLRVTIIYIINCNLAWNIAWNIESTEIEQRTGENVNHLSI